MKKVKNILNNNAGFTMMELIVAMIIVSILTAGGLYVYSKYMGISKVTSAAGQVNAMKASVLNYMSQNQGSIQGVTVSDMVTQGVLGKSWTATAGLAPGTACPADSTTIYHCDPWNGAISVVQDANFSNVYEIEFGLVPENDAYKIAADFFNSLDNTDSGQGSGAIFNGAALTPNDTQAEISNTVGTLTLYFRA
jgi:prepilin-type N-terminal cleavage/methylation domain-containing protein